jgi:hypothetical protein
MNAILRVQVFVLQRESRPLDEQRAGEGSIRSLCHLIVLPHVFKPVQSDPSISRTCRIHVRSVRTYTPVSSPTSFLRSGNPDTTDHPHRPIHRFLLIQNSLGYCLPRIPRAPHAVREILPGSNGPFGRDAFRGYVVIVVFRRQCPLGRRWGARASSAAGLSGCVLARADTRSILNDGPERDELVPFFQGSRRRYLITEQLFAGERQIVSLAARLVVRIPGKCGGSCHQTKACVLTCSPAQCRPNAPILSQSQPPPLKRRTRRFPSILRELCWCSSSV